MSEGEAGKAHLARTVGGSSEPSLGGKEFAYRGASGGRIRRQPERINMAVIDGRMGMGLGSSAVARSNRESGLPLVYFGLEEEETKRKKGAGKAARHGENVVRPRVISIFKYNITFEPYHIKFKIYVPIKKFNSLNK